THMSEALGWDVVAPVMSDKGWNIEQETDVLLEYIDAEDFDLIAGSSMGGLAAANASARRPDAQFGLLLIAPAFGLSEMWRTALSPEEMEVWEQTDSRAYHHHGFGHDITLDWEFMQTADKMSWPELNHPTVILHGIQDEIVPLENSRRVAHKDSNVVALMEIEDGHRMQEAKEHFAKAAELCLRT
ncbi:MAG: alpha/beta hydrolase, partial [Candidatus Poseidoniales archaeon]|nr:alpha/beta hydrolase [Candidatus Poseidoniales archaeon]